MEHGGVLARHLERHARHPRNARPVHDVAASVEAGHSTERILIGYPGLTVEQVELVTLYAEANPARGLPRRASELPSVSDRWFPAAGRQDDATNRRRRRSAGGRRCAPSAHGNQTDPNTGQRCGANDGYDYVSHQPQSPSLVHAIADQLALLSAARPKPASSSAMVAASDLLIIVSVLVAVSSTVQQHMPAASRRL